MKHTVLALAFAAGLAIGTVAPASALDTSVTLNCSDGTSVKLVVDADALASLTQSVQAMIDYPAGLSCTLIQNPLGVSFGSIVLADSPGQNPFIVGGGRWQVPCLAVGLPIPGLDPGLVARVPGAWSYWSVGSRSSSVTDDDFVWINIAVNVHQKDGGFVGTLNETIPHQVTSCGEFTESHFTSKPVCVSAIAEGAPVYVTSQVTQTDGTFPNGASGFINEGPPGDFVHFGFQDNGFPQNKSAAHDTLNGPPVVFGDPATGDCSAASNPLPIFNLGTFDFQKQNGNISVHKT